MHFFFLTCGLVAIISATCVKAQGYPSQSSPFFLRLNSTDPEIDGSVIMPVHAGSIRKHLAFAQVSIPDDRDRFFLNTSDTSEIDGVKTGILVWNLPRREPMNGLDHDSMSMKMYQIPVSNIATTSLTLGAGDSARIGFDSDNKLFYVWEYSLNDGTIPLDQIGRQRFFYQWQVCTTYHDLYIYTDLAWNTGGEPTNPSCRPVNVTREF
ncbi:hypothetical protein B0T21DRAFT_415951 [Apiosordaria backusii]|uniref:DUF7907 domain-containing protein n=1 Tax=Apiosordaria backusii TaxID=314023 RepID=A0AA40A6V0_9PEZI|nr:hypothetical protein B0T21DRAFT_415951 [Apiosordaria backusii]